MHWFICWFKRKITSPKTRVFDMILTNILNKITIDYCKYNGRIVSYAMLNDPYYSDIHKWVDIFVDIQYISNICGNFILHL